MRFSIRKQEQNWLLTVMAKTDTVDTTGILEPYEALPVEGEREVCLCRLHLLCIKEDSDFAACPSLPTANLLRSFICVSSLYLAC